MMENSSTILIQLQNLTKKFDQLIAVDHINLNIRKGEVIGFLGPNGAGKTTTMKMIANLLRPTTGEILIHHNENLISMSQQNREFLLNNIGFMIENPAFYKTSTPRQILTYFAKLKGYPRKKIKNRVEEIMKLVGLTQWIDNKLGTFSKGMRQKIGVLSAIVHDPKIIILDEPYTGLDPEARRELRDFILQLKDMEKTIFLSSHLLYEVSEIADRIAIISNGRIIVCDTLDNLEELARESIIDVEIIASEINPTSIIERFREIIGDLNGNREIWYTPDNKIYKIQFDGSPQKQNAILKALINANIPIIEYSVPKASLLEAMYLKFISQSSKESIQAKKASIEIDAII